MTGANASPRKQDVVFGVGKTWHENACLNHSGGNEGVYSRGFRQAALQLAEQVCVSAQGQDILIYPIIYLYRHYVEIALKSIIELALDLLDRSVLKSHCEIFGQHSLSKLWMEARPLLNPVCMIAKGPSFPSEDLDGIQSYIEQIHRYDASGQTFRYANQKVKAGGDISRFAEKVPLLDWTLFVVNIRDFANALERLADYLQMIENYFDILQMKRHAALDANVDLVAP